MFRIGLVLTHKIIYHQIGLEASQLFKFSRRTGLRKNYLDLFNKPGETEEDGTPLHAEIKLELFTIITVFYNLNLCVLLKANWSVSFCWLPPVLASNCDEDLKKGIQ